MQESELGDRIVHLLHLLNKEFQGRKNSVTFSLDESDRSLEIKMRSGDGEAVVSTTEIIPLVQSENEFEVQDKNGLLHYVIGGMTGKIKSKLTESVA